GGLAPGGGRGGATEVDGGSRLRPRAPGVGAVGGGGGLRVGQVSVKAVGGGGRLRVGQVSLKAVGGGGRLRVGQVSLEAVGVIGLEHDRVAFGLELVELVLAHDGALLASPSAHPVVPPSPA